MDGSDIVVMFGLTYGHLRGVMPALHEQSQLLRIGEL